MDNFNNKGIFKVSTNIFYQITQRTCQCSFLQTTSLTKTEAYSALCLTARPERGREGEEKGREEERGGREGERGRRDISALGTALPKAGTSHFGDLSEGLFSFYTIILFCFIFLNRTFGSLFT